MTHDNNLPVVMLWRVSYGYISRNPVKCLDLGQGMIKVCNGISMRQPRDQYNESYHETKQAAVFRMMADLQRDVNRATKELANSKRRLANARSKWENHVVIPAEHL